MKLEVVAEVSTRLGVAPTCRALDVSRATYYRRQKPPAARKPRRSHRALSERERRDVLDVLTSERFVDMAPASVHATLLDEERYLCSVRSMYRILAANDAVRERRDQLRHPAYAAPELLATAPNTLWSWDITKLLGPSKWTYFYLYVILDVFSRYVVGWMLAERESNELARKLIEMSVERQGVAPDELTLHADRGPSMRSKPVALLLSDLGVTKTHSRPYTSTDNPFSEAQFKTMKYRPGYPGRFGSRQDANAFCQAFFPWYNTEHRHESLGYMTPHDVHHGLADEKRERRAEVLLRAHVAHPERFPLGTPSPAPLPSEVWINKPESGKESATAQ